MVGLGALAEPRLLDLDEIADPGALADLGAGAQPRIGADLGAGGDRRALDMAEGADRDALADRDAGAEDDVGLDHAVAADLGVVGEPDRLRRDQGDAVGHRLGAPAALPGGLDLRPARRGC